MSHEAGSGTMRGADARPEAFRFIGAMIESGMPLGQGLRALGCEIGDARARIALLQIADELDSGASLSEALEKHRSLFPEHWRGLIAAGLRTGRLGELLAGILAERSLHREVWHRLFLRLIYPTLLLLTCLVFYFVLGVSSGHAMSQVVKDFGIQQPWLSAELMRMTDAIAEVGPWLAGGAVLGMLLAAVLFRFALTPLDRRRFLLSLPLFGSIYRFLALSEFCRVLAWLFRARVPLGESLALAGAGVNDPVLTDSCVQVASALDRGRSIDEAIGLRPPFPPGFARFLSWVVSLPAPEDGARLASEIFEARARAQSRATALFLSVLAVVIMFWGYVAYLVFLWPLVELLTKLV